MARYDKLVAWLHEHPRVAFQATFAQIEEVLASPLPDSARRHAPYWSTHNHVGRVIGAAGWRASPRFSSGLIHFTPASEDLQPQKRARVDAAPEGEQADPDLTLIGCVKVKRLGTHRAKDLYTSPLFKGRRAWAEQSHAPWFILSAKYGLVSPDEEIESYDQEMKQLSPRERQDWSGRVLSHLVGQYGSLSGKTVEIHAGVEYRNHGLVGGLKAQGVKVVVPLEHLGMGEQIAWYQGSPGSDSSNTDRPAIEARSTVGRADVTALVRDLTTAFVHGTLDLKDRQGAPIPGWNALPEYMAANALRTAGASNAQVRAFLTYVAALDRAREANQLWRDAARLVDSAPWVIDAQQVASRSLFELRDCLAEYGVSRQHTSDTAAWRLIAESLINPNSPESVRTAIERGTGHAGTLLADVRSLAPSNQSWFPFLAGPKVSAMWVRMLIAPGGAVITGTDAIPVAVDVQVRKVSEFLGITNSKAMSLDEARPVIQAAWRSGTAAAAGPSGLEGTAAAIDPAVWFFGKWGCTHCQDVGYRRPVHAICEGCRFEKRGTEVQERDER